MRPPPHERGGQFSNRHSDERLPYMKAHEDAKLARGRSYLENPDVERGAFHMLPPSLRGTAMTPQQSDLHRAGVASISSGSGGLTHHRAQPGIAPYAGLSASGPLPRNISGWDVGLKDILHGMDLGQGHSMQPVRLKDHRASPVAYGTAYLNSFYSNEGQNFPMAAWAASNSLPVSVQRKVKAKAAAAAVAPARTWPAKKQKHFEDQVLMDTQGFGNGHAVSSGAVPGPRAGTMTSTSLGQSQFARVYSTQQVGKGAFPQAAAQGRATAPRHVFSVPSGIFSSTFDATSSDHRHVSPQSPHHLPKGPSHGWATDSGGSDFSSPSPLATSTSRGALFAPFATTSTTLSKPLSTSYHPVLKTKNATGAHLSHTTSSGSGGGALQQQAGHSSGARANRGDGAHGRFNSHDQQEQTASALSAYGHNSGTGWSSDTASREQAALPAASPDLISQRMDAMMKLSGEFDTLLDGVKSEVAAAEAAGRAWAAQPLVHEECKFLHAQPPSLPLPRLRPRELLESLLPLPPAQSLTHGLGLPLDSSYFVSTFPPSPASSHTTATPHSLIAVTSVGSADTSTSQVALQPDTSPVMRTSISSRSPMFDRRGASPSPRLAAANVPPLALPQTARFSPLVPVCTAHVSNSTSIASSALPNRTSCSGSSRSGGRSGDSSRCSSGAVSPAGSLARQRHGSSSSGVLPSPGAVRSVLCAALHDAGDLRHDKDEHKSDTGGACSSFPAATANQLSAGSACSDAVIHQTIHTAPHKAMAPSATAGTAASRGARLSAQAASSSSPAPPSMQASASPRQPDPQSRPLSALTTAEEKERQELERAEELALAVRRASNALASSPRPDGLAPSRPGTSTARPSARPSGRRPSGARISAANSRPYSRASGRPPMVPHSAAASRASDGSSKFATWPPPSISEEPTQQVQLPTNSHASLPGSTILQGVENAVAYRDDSAPSVRPDSASGPRPGEGHESRLHSAGVRPLSASRPLSARAWSAGSQRHPGSARGNASVVVPDDAARPTGAAQPLADTNGGTAAAAAVEAYRLDSARGSVRGQSAARVAREALAERLAEQRAYAQEAVADAERMKAGGAALPPAPAPRPSSRSGSGKVSNGLRLSELKDPTRLSMIRSSGLTADVLNEDVRVQPYISSASAEAEREALRYAIEAAAAADAAVAAANKPRSRPISRRDSSLRRSLSIGKAPADSTLVPGGQVKEDAAPLSTAGIAAAVTAGMPAASSKPTAPTAAAAATAPNEQHQEVATAVVPDDDDLAGAELLHEEDSSLAVTHLPEQTGLDLDEEQVGLLNTTAQPQQGSITGAAGTVSAEGSIVNMGAEEEGISYSVSSSARGRLQTPGEFESPSKPVVGSTLHAQLAATAPPLVPRARGPATNDIVEEDGLRLLGRKYEVLHVVGEGAYGLVMKCRIRGHDSVNTEHEKFVAIKEFKIEDDDPDADDVKRTSQREVALLKDLQHPNVVEFVDEFMVRDRLFITMEFVPCNLLELLEAQPGGMDREAVRLIMFQLCTAITFIHSKGVVYRDIKPENLLVDERGRIKLCDFGFARYIRRPDDQLTDYVATRWYRAPELLLGPPFKMEGQYVQYLYNEGIDMWACGCLLGELMDGEPLFPGDSDLDQLYRIQKVLGPIIQPHQQLFNQNPHNTGIVFNIKKPQTLQERYKDKMNEQELDFLAGLLHLDPAQRLTGQQCLEHPYLADLYEATFGAPERPTSTPLPSVQGSARGSATQVSTVASAVYGSIGSAESNGHSLRNGVSSGNDSNGTGARKSGDGILKPGSADLQILGQDVDDEVDESVFAEDCGSSIGMEGEYGILEDLGASLEGTLSGAGSPVRAGMEYGTRSLVGVGGASQQRLIDAC